MKRIAILFSVIFIFILTASGQSRIIDSLRLRLSERLHDTDRINTLSALCPRFDAIGRSDSALYYGEQALKLAFQRKHSGLGSYYARAAAVALGRTGNVYRIRGDLYIALKRYQLALSIFKKMGLKKQLATSYNNIGIVYKHLGRFTDALNYLFSALRMREQMHDTISCMESYNNIGNLFLANEKPEQSFKYHTLSWQLAKKFGDKRQMAMIYANIGAAHDQMKRKDLALENYEYSLQVAEKLNDKRLRAMAKSNIGLIQYETGKFAESEKNLIESMQMYMEMNANTDVGAVLSALGKLYNVTGNDKKSKEAFTKCISLTNDIIWLRNAYQGLEELNSKLGNWKEATQNYKMYIMYRDSMVSAETTKKAVQQQMQYEFDKKESAAKADQIKKDAVAAEEKRRQEIVLWCVAGGLALVLLFALFLFNAYRNKRKANVEISRQKEIIEMKQKEVLDSIYYARRIQRALVTSEYSVHRMLKRLQRTQIN